MHNRRPGQVTVNVGRDALHALAQIGRILKPDIRDRLPVRFDAANGNGIRRERLRLDLKPQVERRAPGRAELLLERGTRPVSKRLPNDLAENQVAIPFTGVVRQRRAPDFAKQRYRHIGRQLVEKRGEHGGLRTIAVSRLRVEPRPVDRQVEDRMVHVIAAKARMPRDRRRSLQQQA